jgi:hypothetical protein
MTATSICFGLGAGDEQVVEGLDVRLVARGDQGGLGWRSAGSGDRKPGYVPSCVGATSISRRPRGERGSVGETARASHSRSARAK